MCRLPSASRGCCRRRCATNSAGSIQQQQIAFRGLIEVFAAALAAVFVLLLFLYESFRVALAILMMPLFAVCAVFVGLWLTGVELNITAMMG